MDDRTGDGSTSSTTTRQDDLHDLPGGAFPGDGPQPAADVADVAAVADAAVHVAEHAARQRGVEELRPVVRRDRRRASGRSTPRPRATRLHRQAQHTVVTTRDAGRRGQRRAVDGADAVEERAGTQPPDQDREDTTAPPSEACPRPYGLAHLVPDLLGGCWPGFAAVSRRTIPIRSTRGRRPRFIGLHPGSASRSAWCTVTASRPAAAPPAVGARRRRSRRSARACCSHAAPSQPVNHSAVRAASRRRRAARGWAGRRPRRRVGRTRRRRRRRRPGRAARPRSVTGAGGR